MTALFASESNPVTPGNDHSFRDLSESCRGAEAQFELRRLGKCEGFPKSLRRSIRWPIWRIGCADWPAKPKANNF